MNFQWSNVAKVLFFAVCVAAVATRFPTAGSFLFGVFAVVAAERFWPFSKK